jgi:TetR/AcrR family transcriptional regulator, mexJK operon transcriptional repressor
MVQSATRIRKGRKFDQVLEGARTVFLADGFERANVDEIARVAGVSKATLYSYFPDKRLLFTEVLRNECNRQADEALSVIDLTAPPAVVLRAAAERIIAFQLSEFGLAMHRICVAETPKFPEIGRQFYESGPLLARARLGGYLRLAAERGELAIEDFDLAADQFVRLCLADIYDRQVCGIEARFAPDEIVRVIDGAVQMFLALYSFPAKG